MGSLTLPENGLVYFDANSMIYSVEKIDPYSAVLESAWQIAETGRIEIASSQLVLLECLVKPLMAGDDLLEEVYRDLLLHSQQVRLFPVGLDILDLAAKIRAETRLKAPDAIHAATALDIGAGLFVTNDFGFRRVPGLPVVILSEVVAAE